MPRIQDGYQYTITIRGFATFDPNRPETVPAALAHIQGKLIEAKRIGPASCDTKFRRRRDDGGDAAEPEADQEAEPEATRVGPPAPRDDPQDRSDDELLAIPANMRRTKPEADPDFDESTDAPLAAG